MRLSSKKKISYSQFMFTLANIALVIGVGIFVLHSKGIYIFAKSTAVGIIGFSFFLYFVFYIKGRQFFEYDSDGETLNFQNRNIIAFLGKDARDEFPKYKLVSYDIIDTFLFRKLYVKIKSKKGNLTVLKYDISYLSNREVKDLKLSLNRTIKLNQENSNNRDIK
ncbi:hypothetical protein PG637_08490 [Riemerella anatipestifer]|uniref:hypothetical protein n=1 Tax=Riemerella anatipestifer TaxID=34085 RepID=UPI00129D6EF1|nr:hypothetical protein [Riemerella anatipestifer]MDY3317476.1 hypothetical protein [Riemerella anatipestifer]MDY3319430.1 hypothetical protein [Riemerella anatipestifer]MDY3325701.1 hypothetical protein [Riemerella anatipestifer]MDY3354243.1 hypothetical protein [Riemerella anatipestifer]MRM82286.1 hypothetical protein [Riemerella anatipestifer]